MAFIDKYEFDTLVNQAEKLVITELERQLESQEEDLCRCEECVLDMAAMALNSVTPLYRVSLLGTMYASQAMDDPAYAKTLREAVREAIAQVRAHPSHD